MRCLQNALQHVLVHLRTAREVPHVASGSKNAVEDVALGSREEIDVWVDVARRRVSRPEMGAESDGLPDDEESRSRTVRRGVRGQGVSIGDLWRQPALWDVPP